MPPKMENVMGRVALVTGGTRGIGGASVDPCGMQVET